MGLQVSSITNNMFAVPLIILFEDPEANSTENEIDAVSTNILVSVL